MWLQVLGVGPCLNKFSNTIFDTAWTLQGCIFHSSKSYNNFRQHTGQLISMVIATWVYLWLCTSCYLNIRHHRLFLRKAGVYITNIPEDTYNWQCKLERLNNTTWWRRYKTKQIALHNKDINFFHASQPIISQPQKTKYTARSSRAWWFSCLPNVNTDCESTQESKKRWKRWRGQNKRQIDQQKN